MTSIAMQYAHNVIDGKVVVGELTRLAVKRHFDDLKHGGKRGLYFDEVLGAKVIEFFGFLKHSKGPLAGQKISLSPYQQFNIWCKYGWRNNDGTRRFRLSYEEVARKNGKTTEKAGEANYHLIADGESGAEVYTAATKRDQAKLCFMEARRQVTSSGLKKYVDVRQHNMNVTKTMSKMEPLSSDSDKQDGLNPSFIVIDEYHAHKNSELYDVLKSALGARTQPMLSIITTAGFNRESPCFQLRRTAVDVLKGKLKDDTFFIMIYALDEEDDWTDPEVWIKANPNMDVSIKKEYLEAQFLQARNNSSEEVNFKTKHLNMWVGSSMSWIDDISWMKCDKGGDPADLIGRECYGGLDLAATTDTNALILIFPRKEEDGMHFDVLCHFWIPESKVEQKADQVDYYRWEQEGHINTCEGDIVNHKRIIDKIRSVSSDYQLKGIAYDKYLTYATIFQDLTHDELPMHEMSQGIVHMTEPTKEIERITRTGRFNHYGQPVMRWQMGNINLHMDDNGNIKISKKKSIEKVDGPVALAMAVGEWMSFNQDQEEFIYEPILSA